MRKLLYLCITTLFIVATLAACSPDKCKRTQCPSNASCVQGTCFCQPGYEGTNCDIVSREKLIGTYIGTNTTLRRSGTKPDTTIIDSNVIVVIEPRPTPVGLDGIYVTVDGYKKECTVQGNTFGYHRSYRNEADNHGMSGEVNGQQIYISEYSNGPYGYKSNFVGVRQ